MKHWKLIKLVKMAYSPCKTLGCGIILNTMHGSRDIFQGKGNNVGGDHAKITISLTLTLIPKMIQHIPP